jgi:glycosyltransferase involved in cell wall biosynthesis
LLARLKSGGVRLFLGQENWRSGLAVAGQAYAAVIVTNPATLMAIDRQSELYIRAQQRMLVLVFQTRMFCLNRGVWDVHNNLVGKIFKRFPAENIVFANTACKVTHAQELATDFSRSAVIPLIVDGERFSRRSERVNRADALRIVSIGRLEHFKTYNLTMLDVVRRLRQDGLNVHWEVYGSGPLQGKMAETARDYDIADAVSFRGDINYDEIPRALSQAFGFVGSGLSVMEAAAMGVPSIPAIEYSQQPRTFGFISDIAGDSFFEPGIYDTEYDIADLLRELALKSELQYEALGDRCRERMTSFFSNNVAQKYLDAIVHARSGEYAPTALESRCHRMLLSAFDLAKKMKANLRGNLRGDGARKK